MYTLLHKTAFHSGETILGLGLRNDNCHLLIVCLALYRWIYISSCSEIKCKLCVLCCWLGLRNDNRCLLIVLLALIWMGLWNCSVIKGKLCMYVFILQDRTDDPFSEKQ